ncbi:hypothetical protein KUF71_016687 [Frankliniella fusca]|uniref:DUF4706 domain-containing protein n=1 Tax=Frankliniella fusca TaxID=407009 RepID=A0AAE1HXG9_9NEOP|nr:hypothetical protein KUF71_016687 [Frankliniella fusca]
MSSTSLQTVAEEYFHSLNPIAERISADVASTRDAYEELWNTLSAEEQKQVIDETIIYPEAVLKYAFEDSLERPEFSPRLNIQTGGKYIIDDEGSKGSGLTWRDEHSAPFSWLTQSQLNLSLAGEKAIFTASPPQVKPRLAPFRGPHTPPKAENGLKVNGNRVENGTELSNNSDGNRESFIDPPRVVLGGSAGNTAKLASVIGAKLKFPATGKGNGVPSPNGTGNNNPQPTEDAQSSSLLSKLKSKTGILKIPASLKNVANGKGSTENASRNKNGDSDRENLVQGKNNINVLPAKHNKAPAPKPPVAKPKTPPPPPPSKRKSSCEGMAAMDPERMALLGDSWSSELSGAQSSKSATMKSAAESLAMATDSASDMETASSSVRSPSVTSPPRETAPDFMEPLTDNIPKTGFEFLDNW